MITVACVWAGTKYSADYVSRLESAVSEHLDQEHEFVCFTDQEVLPDFSGVNFRKLPDLKFQIRYPWWYKIWLFSADSGLTGRILYLDLDVMLTQSISKFPSYTGSFLGLRDFTRVKNHKVTTTNSSIMCWDHELYRHLWQTFENNPREIQQNHAGDQNFISAQLRDQIIWWPDSWALSYRWEFLVSGAQTETAVIVFHGSPKPHEIDWQLPLL